MKLIVGSRVVKDASDISSLLLSHFKQRFNTDWPVNGYFDDFCLPSISLKHAQFLEHRFFVEEVRSTVWSCASHKAPEPDGINFYFYKKVWGTIKDDVFKLIDSFYRSGKLPQSLKSSFITLIVKKCLALRVD